MCPKVEDLAARYSHTETSELTDRMAAAGKRRIGIGPDRRRQMIVGDRSSCGQVRGRRNARRSGEDEEGVMETHGWDRDAVAAVQSQGL